MRTGRNGVKMPKMTLQQKQALKEARSPKHTRTSEEAYAQMDRMMGKVKTMAVPVKVMTIGTNRKGNGVNFGSGLRKSG